MICSLAGRSQRIDSIQTDEQALAYIKSLALSQVFAELFHLGKGDSLYLQRFGARVFEKADFDGDGRTDLLFNGIDPTASPSTQSFIFFARDSVWPECLTRKKGLGFFTARLITLDDEPAIVYKDNEQQDTVVYKDGAFIERTFPRPLVFETLKLCISGDDAYSLTLYKDSVQIDDYPFSPTSYCAKLDHNDYKKLMECINHIDWEHLKIRKPLRPFDVPSGCLSIVGSDGKTRHINDFEFSDSYSLTELKHQLGMLHRKLNWVSTGESHSCLCDYYNIFLTPDEIAPISDTLNSLYRYLSATVDTIYLADFITDAPDRDYSDYGYPDEGTQLRSLLDSGVVEIATPQQIQQWLLPSKVALSGMKKFLEIKMPPMALTRQERRIRKKQNRVWLKYGDDHADIKKLQWQDSVLRENKYARSADLKFTKCFKRLMIFGPLLRYKDRVLIRMSFYTPQRREEGNYTYRIVQL